MFKEYQSKKNLAIFIAVLFHVCGFIGIAFTPYKNWFVQTTWFNLILMASLLVFTNKDNSKHFWYFVATSCSIGFLVEVVGVNTGLLFGNYTYGGVLGFKWFNVPVLIGVQWFVTIYCCGVITYNIQRWIENRVLKETGKLPELQHYNKVQVISLVIDGALLAVIFDYTLEPIAQKLGYWTWANHKIPVYNYVCWFIVSAVLLLLLRMFKFSKVNHFALHLFIIQLLFFVALSLFL
jgi:bisanhydrobacterioruberin hydratase